MKDALLTLGNLFNVLPDAVIVIDGTGHIVHANDAVHSVLGYDSQNLIGEPLSILIPERYRDLHNKQIREYYRRGRPTTMGSRPILHALHCSGTEVPLSISITNLDLDETRFSVAIVRDATPVRDHLEEITALAERDPLTGLGNRLALSRCIQESQAKRHPFALLYIDLSKFKPFNDRYGHKIGDEVLKHLALRLQAQVRRCDIAARVGGDEFVLLLCDLYDDVLLAARAHEIVTQIRQPLRIETITGSLDANLGGAIYPHDGTTEEALVTLADRNMYVAKNRGVYYHYQQATDALAETS